MPARYAFFTSYSPEECRLRLRNALRPFPMFMWGMPEEETSYGSVGARSFNVARMSAYDARNSFIPVLYGRIFPAPEGSRIEFIIRPPAVVYSFMLVFQAVMIAGFAGIWRAYFAGPQWQGSAFDVLSLAWLVYVSMGALIVPWFVFVICTASGKPYEHGLQQFVVRTLTPSVEEGKRRD